MSYRFIIFCSIFFVLFACKSKTKAEFFAEEASLTLEDIFEDPKGHFSVLDSLSEQDIDFLKNQYKSNDYKTFFHSKKGKLSNLGEQLEKQLENSLYWGIPKNRVVSTDSLPFKIKDIQLYLGWLRMVDDLKFGFSDSLKNKQRSFSLTKNESFQNIKKLNSDDSWKKYWNAFLPANEDFQMMLVAHQKHIDTANLNVKLYKIIPSKEDSITSYSDAMENLRILNFPFEESENPVDVIKRFQKDKNVRADGEIGQSTIQLLEESPLDLAYRFAWNLEKLRYQKEYPKRYFLANIPEFKLYFFNADTIASIHNIVVGKFENQTPALVSRMSHIQLFPKWNVPYSIASKEILPAVQANRNYLERNKMEVFRGNTQVDPSEINWSKLTKKNLPYKFVQTFGPHNSLGIIKFEFYNKYDVYIHDTPQKSLLNTPNRMYSHGCVRCQNPIDLAKKVFEIDDNKIVSDTLDSLIQRKEPVKMNLKKGIPIHLEYNSIAIHPVLIKDYKNKPDEYEKRLFIFRDIYEKDEIHYRYFFGKKDFK